LKPKRIYIIRHGETAFNNLGILQGGNIDSDLNELGRKQSEFFYQHYQKINFDNVYTSTLKRSIQSVDSFLKAGFKHTALAELNEIHFGTSNERSDSQFYNDLIADWKAGKTTSKIAGGESPNEVQLRLKIGAQKILSHADEECILICMHGRAIRILLCTLLNYPLKYMDVFHHQNLCLYRLTYTGKLFSLDAYNDLSHLKIE